MPGARDVFDAVRGTGLVERLVKRGWLVGEERVDPAILGSASQGCAYVLEHPRLPFVSYPYEWGFAALRAAALRHLDVQLEALAADVSLSDSSAYNIQFVGSEPTFIDHLSFRPYSPGEYWAGHGQFCQQFLNPLLLRAHCGVAHNNWYRGSLEGIDVIELSRLLPWSRKYLSWGTLTHVTLQAKLQVQVRNRERAVRAVAQRGLPKPAFGNMLKSLHAWISTLTPADVDRTVWGDYANRNSYSEAEAQAKRAFVHDMVAQTKPGLLWDLGCNTGDYSKAALEAGARYVVGFDFDQQALDKAYLRARAESLKFLPLYFDAANPSPAQGWLQSERMGLRERSPANALLALAVVHHLAIARNAPLEQVVGWLMDSAPAGIIEFVPKTDPMVQELLKLRSDIFPDYTEERFLDCIRQRGEIVRQSVVSSSGRLLVWYRR